MLKNIRIVLVNTSHPGNIGSAARAMKTMGLSELYLVSPELFPSGKATAMASNADDVLQNATIVDSLEDAIADCQLVMATSARKRERPWPVIDAKVAAEKAKVESSQGKVAIVFGRENAGLTNEELQLAQFHVQIPANPDYSVLNLAAAVQVLCYELRLASLAGRSENAPVLAEHPTSKMLEDFYDHFEQMLIDIEFLDPNHPMQTMTKLRRLLTRARLELSEVSMLRGIFADTQKKLNKS